MIRSERFGLVKYFHSNKSTILSHSLRFKICVSFAFKYITRTVSKFNRPLYYNVPWRASIQFRVVNMAKTPDEFAKLLSTAFSVCSFSIFSVIMIFSFVNKSTERP